MRKCCLKNSTWDLVGKNKIYTCSVCEDKTIKRLDHLYNEPRVNLAINNAH